MIYPLPDQPVAILNHGSDSPGRTRLGIRRLRRLLNMTYGRSNSVSQTLLDPRLVKVNGNCCWRVYPHEHYRGSPVRLDRGMEAVLEFSPASVRKVECG